MMTYIANYSGAAENILPNSKSFKNIWIIVLEVCTAFIATFLRFMG